VRRRAAPRRGGLAWLAFAAPLAALVVAAGVGLALLGWALGWLAPAADAEPEVPPGMVAVPAAAVAIPTYTRIGLQHLVDPRTGAPSAVFLPEGSLLPETLVDARQIVGRVLAAEKAPGQLFAERDFFPPGTREGLVAGIPPGKRALRVDARKVNGLAGLGRGDRFDLVATVDLAGGGRGAMRPQASRSGVLGPLGTAARVVLVAEDAAVVQPLATRSVAGATRAVVVEEMVIAIDAEEVPLFTEALHAGAQIDCVPRSGRPDGADADGRAARAGARRAEISVVETISGSQRQVVAVPSPAPRADRFGDE
jgi:Flp pilus assembly protein CpaB